MNRTLFLLPAVVLVAGCSTPRMMTQPEYQSRPQIERSLFSGDDQIAEEDIQKEASLAALTAVLQELAAFIRGIG